MKRRVGRYMARSLRRKRERRLVHNGLVGERVYLAIQIEPAGWMKLPHENDNHVFLGIDGKLRVEEAAPAIGPGRAQFFERRFHTIEAEPDTKRLVIADMSQLI